MTVLTAATLMFLVMDPFGNIPLFISSLKSVDERRRQHVIVRELVIALIVLVLFLFSGQYILSTLHISASALTTAGGIVLFLIAIKMIFPVAGHASAEELQGEPFIVPLAVPYIAGPSAMAFVLLIMNQEPSRWPEWLAALMIAWFACGLIIYCSSFLAKILGVRVLIAIERLTGMLLVVMAVQMVMNGVSEYVTRLNG